MSEAPRLTSPLSALPPAWEYGGKIGTENRDPEPPREKSLKMAYIGGDVSAVLFLFFFFSPSGADVLTAGAYSHETGARPGHGQLRVFEALHFSSATSTLIRSRRRAAAISWTARAGAG